jgi:hypothetical protein
MYCVKDVKFSVRDLHIMLLRVYAFRENLRRQGRTLYGRYWVSIDSFTVKPYGKVEVKNALVKLLYYVMEYTISRLLLYLLLQVSRGSTP